MPDRTCVEFVLAIGASHSGHSPQDVRVVGKKKARANSYEMAVLFGQSSIDPWFLAGSDGR